MKKNPGTTSGGNKLPVVVYRQAPQVKKITRNPSVPNNRRIKSAPKNQGVDVRKALMDILGKLSNPAGAFDSPAKRMARDGYMNAGDKNRRNSNRFRAENRYTPPQKMTVTPRSSRSGAEGPKRSTPRKAAPKKRGK